MNDPTSSAFDLNAEWLEADGLGGYASGTVGGWRTRRYHAILLTSATPPTNRKVYVNGFEATVLVGDAAFSISTQQYVPDVTYPRGYEYLQSFTEEPWPKWVYRLPDGLVIEFELFVPRGYSGTVLKWQVRTFAEDCPLMNVELVVRPLMSGRDYHSLLRENSVFCFEASVQEGQIEWRPHEDASTIRAFTSGNYTPSPDWYRQFFYSEEAARGLDSTEDLASPGELRFQLSTVPALLVLTDDGPWSIRKFPGETIDALVDRLAEAERSRRQGFATRLHRSAADYLVLRGSGRTIVAGYPWFTDWGRDTFISLRGLCLATGQIEEAGRILTEWSQLVSEGMLPNRFPDHGDAPEYNSVDASLWYIVAVHDYLKAARIAGHPRFEADRKMLQVAVNQILLGYAQGTRFGIQVDDDGLLWAGVQGAQVTWMDAKCGDWVVTPRIGKPVEVQALWLNALWIGSRMNSGWEKLFQRARESFHDRFWNTTRRCLFDVVDVNHEPGVSDGSVRPNQIFAVGGLPLNLLSPVKSQLVVQIVEDRLLTPMGLRSLDPQDPSYCGTYSGDAGKRDGAYHQGTVWPWLNGPFTEAWLRVRGNTSANRQTAHCRFVQPLLDHLPLAGLGHVSEIAEGDWPHKPTGCPFQAWSVGELLRMMKMVAEPAESAG